MNNVSQNWQSLARLASEEQDPEKLMELVRQLNIALENSDCSLGSSISDAIGSTLPTPNDQKTADAAA
jgi:hypothetical protein